MLVCEGGRGKGLVKEARDELSWAGIEELGVMFAILEEIERVLSCGVVGFGNSFGIEERRVRLRDEENIDILMRKETL